jgi:DNA-directed RNA polymerase subunit RPC12/RpoP
MHWYYVDEGVQVGPLTEQEFDELVQVRKITRDTVVWHDGLAEWQPYGSLNSSVVSVPAPPLKIALDSMPALRCSECGREFPEDELIRYQNSLICTSCKPIFFQRLREGVAAPGALTYAGFWVRFGAKFIDGLVFVLWELIVIFAFGPFLGFSFTSTRPPTSFTFLWIYPIIFGFSIFYSVFFVGKYREFFGHARNVYKSLRSILCRDDQCDHLLRWLHHGCVR